MSDTPSAEQPVAGRHGRWLGRDEVVSRLRRFQADPGLRDDLERLTGDTTDDLRPIARTPPRSHEWS